MNNLMRGANRQRRRAPQRRRPINYEDLSSSSDDELDNLVPLRIRRNAGINNPLRDHYESSSDSLSDNEGNGVEVGNEYLPMPADQIIDRDQRLGWVQVNQDMLRNDDVQPGPADQIRDRDQPWVGWVQVNQDMLWNNDFLSAELSNCNTSISGDEDLYQDPGQDSDCKSDSSDMNDGVNLGSKLLATFKLERLASMLNRVEDGADVSFQNKNRIFPLHHAVRSGNDILVSAMLRAGANPNSLCNGRSALLVAVLGNKTTIASLLLDAKAQVDFCYQNSTRKRTLLHRAVLLVHGQAMIELLLDHGANVNARDNLGESVLRCAARNRAHVMDDLMDQDEYRDRLELLINHGARVEDETFEDVIMYGTLNAVKLFLNNGINLKSFRNRPLLHKARSNPRAEVIKYLLDANLFDFDMKNHAGRTVLHEAVKSRVNNSHLEMLLSYGANPNSLDSLGQPPLFFAMDGQHGKRAMQLLLEYGGCIDRTFLGLMEYNLRHFRYSSICRDHIISQLALLEGHNRNFDSEVRKLIETMYLQDPYQSCKREVDLLKSSTVSGELTFYDILVRENTYRIVDDELVKNALKNAELIKSKFPIYAERIILHFGRLEEKLGAIKGLSRLIGHGTNIFHLVHYKILQNLRPVDIRNLSQV